MCLTARYGTAAYPPVLLAQFAARRASIHACQFVPGQHSNGRGFDTVGMEVDDYALPTGVSGIPGLNFLMWPS